MTNSVYRISCPSCGATFVPPNKEKFFCPQCGMRITDLPPSLTNEEAQDQAAWAADEAARVAQASLEAARMAQGATSGEEYLAAIEAAQQAAAQATQAIHAAQAAQKAQEFHLREQQESLARQAEDMRREHERQDAELKARMEEERKALAARQAREREEAERQAREREEAERRARAVAEAEAAKATEMASQPQPVEYRRNVTVRHTDGRGLYVVTIPSNWGVKSTLLTQSSARAYNPMVALVDSSGSGISLFQGHAGTRLSAGMKAMMAQYGSAIAAVDRTNYANMPDPRVLADKEITEHVTGNGYTNLRLLQDLPSQHLQQRQKEAHELYLQTARMQGNVIVKDPFAAEVLRIYEYEAEGTTKNAAVYVRLIACKDGSGVENINPMGLAFNLGSSIGGLFNRKNRGTQQAKQPQTQRTQPSAESFTWSLPDFDEYVRGGTIYWDVYGIAMLFAPREVFPQRFVDAFLPLVQTYKVHPDVQNLIYAAAQQEAAQVQAATNRQIHAMNMQTQATLAAARQASVVSSARTEEYLRQSDAHHQAFRERTNAQFNSGYGGGTPDFSEAIRGVNTFMTSDGREVELDVLADRAYENQAGDVIGGSDAFEPGADWTEIPRV